MSVKQLHQFHREKEENFEMFQQNEMENQRRRNIAAHYYIFYLSLLLKLSFTNVQSGYAVIVIDPMVYMEMIFTLCKGEERAPLLHRCHIALQHYLVNE